MELKKKLYSVLKIILHAPCVQQTSYENRATFESLTLLFSASLHDSHNSSLNTHVCSKLMSDSTAVCTTERDSQYKFPSSELENDNTGDHGRASYARVNRILSTEKA